MGTANIGQPGPGYTTLESVESAKDLEPLTIGYFQNNHFQSLAEYDDISANITLEESTDVEITFKPYENERVIQDFTNNYNLK